MVLILFALSFYTNVLFFVILAEFSGIRSMVNVHIITDYSVLDRFCFLMHSLLVLMKLSISISGLSHGKAILQKTQCKNKI